MIKTYYKVLSPYSNAFKPDTIEVYGDGENGWYEWRVIDQSGKTIKDTKNQGYGQPEIALRNALIEETK